MRNPATKHELTNADQNITSLTLVTTTHHGLYWILLLLLLLLLLLILRASKNVRSVFFYNLKKLEPMFIIIFGVRYPDTPS